MHTKFEALVNELSRTAKQKISAGQQILSAGIFSTLLASIIPIKIQLQGGKKPKRRILIGSILQFFATNSTRVANGSYYIGCWISIKPGRRRAGSGPRQIRVPATRHGKMIPYSRSAGSLSDRHFRSEKLVFPAPVATYDLRFQFLEPRGASKSCRFCGGAVMASIHNEQK